MKQAEHCQDCGAPANERAQRCAYCGSAFSPESIAADPERSLSELSALPAPSVEQCLVIAELYLVAGKNTHSIQVLERLLARAPSHPRAHLLLCMALLGFNQEVVQSGIHRDRIIAHLAWLRAHAPELRESRWIEHYLAMEDQWQAGEVAAAQRDGEAAVAEFPGNYLLHFMLGLAFCHFGAIAQASIDEVRRAHAHFSLAAEINPRFTPAVANARALADYLTRVLS